MPSELDEFRERQDRFDARLTKVEETVQTESRLRAAMDRDFSDIKVEQRAQRGLLQALADTQSEHTATLRDHTETLRDHTETLRDHTATLAEHTAILNEHTAILNEHSVILAEHTATLAEHTVMLREHGEDIREIKDKLGTVHVGVLAILARLDALDESGFARRIGRLLPVRKRQA